MSEVTALIPRTKLELVAGQIVEFLPDIKDAFPGTKLALAYLAIRYDLDPFLGDLWAIPRKDAGRIVGWSLMLGIRALRKVAFRSGQYNGRSFRWLTEDEAHHLDVDLGKGDKAVACIVYRRDCKEPFVGYGIVRPGEKSKMNHGQLANLRAERDALKAAFTTEFIDLESQLRQVDIQIAEVEDVDLADDNGPRTAQQDIAELFGEPYEGAGTELAVPNEVAELESEPVAAPDDKLHIIRRDVEAIQNFGHLYMATLRDFNLSRAKTLAEMGVQRQEDLVDTPRQVYLQIAATRGVAVIPPEG